MHTTSSPASPAVHSPLSPLRSMLITGACLLALLSGCSQSAPEATPIAPKVVIITMFEIGEDSGDQAGEFQLWKERRGLDTVFPFGAHHDLHYNEDSGIMAMVTGIGTAKAAASVMMLGMDPRFDLSHTYFLVAGIAGVDPEDASIGSAAWAQYLVDGDLAHEIDPREMPEDWEFGYFPRNTTGLDDPEKPEPQGEIFELDAGLTEWAWQLTRDMELPDDDKLIPTRELYTEHPNAQRPPFVLRGENLAALTFWHGELLNDWANAWVDYWTDGKGNFVTSAMEETGTMQSMVYLDSIDRVDRDRVMVLRTASNYSMPPPGVSAADNLLMENEGYAGLDAALESAYLVGSKVVDRLLENWEVYSERLPASSDLQ